ncbi:hypothetical protein [Rouxiella chamberiensis]|uniref:Uncharacterized protein n=1 Tax=Rouxiella chamberiensis TaxID=1513468 RepID=A0ABY7HTE5_9GAMM|nr:hypothetical protein [Rouxiella chamberiensis]WAT02086.1 hypothetical protein O1V66_05245 [Rouxiella chamberiensis]
MDTEKAHLVTASEFTTRENLLREAIRLVSKNLPSKEEKSVISIGDGLWDLKRLKISTYLL